jgi:hypothetical protein
MTTMRNQASRMFHGENHVVSGEAGVSRLERRSRTSILSTDPALESLTVLGLSGRLLRADTICSSDHAHSSCQIAPADSSRCCRREVKTKLVVENGKST